MTEEHQHNWFEHGKGLRGIGVAANSDVVIEQRCLTCMEIRFTQRQPTPEELNIMAELMTNLVNGLGNNMVVTGSLLDLI